MSTRTKIGHGLAKFFNIKIQPNDPYMDDIRAPEDHPGSSADKYIEEPVHVSDVFQYLVPSGRGVFNYVSSLFPFLHWIGRYNLIWLAGDLVAGKY